MVSTVGNLKEVTRLLRRGTSEARPVAARDEGDEQVVPGESKVLIAAGFERHREPDLPDGLHRQEV